MERYVPVVVEVVEVDVVGKTLRPTDAVEAVVEEAVVPEYLPEEEEAPKVDL